MGTREPDIRLHVWIDSAGIRVELEHMHTGYGYDKSFDRVYDKRGQVAAIRESFCERLLEFVDEFRKRR